MSVRFSNVERDAELRALLADLATKAEASAAEQTTLPGEREQTIQHAISGCVREIVLRRQRVGFLMKLGITLIGVPTQVYATFVSSPVVHASTHTSLPAVAV